jgi:hypothetical protein
MALLVSACGFTETKRFIVIKEQRDIDGSFLISSLIGQRMRQQNAGIILACCHQTMNYYDTCGKKLGYNLNMSITKKCLHVIEPLRSMVMALRCDELMDELLKGILQKFKLLQGDGKRNITVIIDDLQVFINLGCSESDLIKFVIKLNTLTQETDGLSLVIKIGLSDLYFNLINVIEDYADVAITVEKLKSGEFFDVDGKLTIRKFNYADDLPVCRLESERSLLYYIGDHNIKLSAPGEFGLKF